MLGTVLGETGIELGKKDVWWNDPITTPDPRVLGLNRNNPGCCGHLLAPLILGIIHLTA